MNIGETCAEIKNFFCKQKYFGTFTISDGKISPFNFIQKNQYFRIIDSVFNDGVYKNIPDELEKLQNETFNGAIWTLSIPQDFIELIEDIKRFNAKVEEMCLIEKGYVSESFGGYSYTLSSYAPAGMIAWEKRINQKLNTWRKI